MSAFRPYARPLRHAILLRGALTLLALGFAGTPVRALDASVSGFATLGYAVSDSPHTHQRFIDRRGTWQRDTVVGGQLDLRLSPAWSATLQARVAPAPDHASRWELHPSWAFVAWRPGDAWLVRLGRMRGPLYLHSESLEVGVSHDMARLPHEVYATTPANDFDGAFVTYTATLGGQDVSLEAYGGHADMVFRGHTRDGLPPAVPAGELYRPIDIRPIGLVATSRGERFTWRLGWHEASSRERGGTPVRYPFVEVAPGIGYWQVSDALPGPGVPVASRVRNRLLTIGFDGHFDHGWRLTAEALRMKQRDTELGSDSVAGYVALFKQVGPWTPYVSLAQQRSGASLREWRRRLLSQPVPAFVPGAAALNAAQRVPGESIFAYDQRSLALGASYAFSPRLKLKAEWMRTRVGDGSNHFDTPAGRDDLRRAHVDTLSVNFNAAF